MIHTFMISVNSCLEVSIFWTYLWFSQFMLIWYSNIPEEVTYFITRIEDYNLPFFGMIAMNFLFPLLILMNSDYKRTNYFHSNGGNCDCFRTLPRCI